MKPRKKGAYSPKKNYLGTCQKLAGGEGGWEFQIWVWKLGDPSLQWE